MAPTLISRCHCGSNSIPLEVPLPFTVHLCHCTSCRTRNGSLFVVNAMIYAGVPFSRDNVPENLQVFTPPPTPDSNKDGSVFFCKKCGCKMFFCFAIGVDAETGKKTFMWGTTLATLSLDPSNPANEGKKLEDVAQLGMQFCVEDTVDGGAAIWTANFSEGAPKICKGGPRKQDDVLTQDDLLGMQRAAKAVIFKDTELAKAAKEIKGSCKCGTTTVVAKRKDTSQRFRGSHCACDTCRLTSGVDVMSYVHIPFQQAFLEADGKQTVWPSNDLEELKKIFPQLKFYESSEKAIRGTCGTCGASAIWMKKGNDAVEFAAGLFGSDTTKGIRHEDCFNWKMDDAEVSHLEDLKAAGRGKILGEPFTKAYDEWKKSGLAF